MYAFFFQSKPCVLIPAPQEKLLLHNIPQSNVHIPRVGLPALTAGFWGTEFTFGSSFNSGWKFHFQNQNTDTHTHTQYNPDLTFLWWPPWNSIKSRNIFLKGIWPGPHNKCIQLRKHKMWNMKSGFYCICIQIHVSFMALTWFRITKILFY